MWESSECDQLVPCQLLWLVVNLALLHLIMWKKNVEPVHTREESLRPPVSEKTHEWPCSGRSFGSVLEVVKNKTQTTKKQNTLKKPLFFFLLFS